MYDFCMLSIGKAYNTHNRGIVNKGDKTGIIEGIHLQLKSFVEILQEMGKNQI